MKPARAVLAITLALALGAPMAWAQDAQPSAKPNPDTLPERTFYLNAVAGSSEGQDLFYAIRNTLSQYAKVQFVQSQNAIIVRSTPDDLALVQKMLNDLERPKKSYRLTYTVTEMDGPKRIGVQHFVMVVASGQKTSLKQNSRVPVSTAPPGVVQTQFSYQDVGMDFDATLDVFPNGARLNTLVNDSSFAQDLTENTSHPPISRHMTLEGASFIIPGKPLMLGAMDIPGSTRHLDVEVVMEPVP